MENIRKLQVFDFDETLFRTPGYCNKAIAERPGLEFPTPYSFFDNPASLDETLYDIHLIEPTFSFWKKGQSSEDTMNILITHRVKEVELEVLTILSKRLILFNKTFFLGRETKKSQTLMEVLLKLTSVTEVEIFEDSVNQIMEYQDFFEQLNKTRSLNRLYQIKPTFYIVDKSSFHKIEYIKISEKTRIQLI